MFKGTPIEISQEATNDDWGNLFRFWLFSECEGTYVLGQKHAIKAIYTFEMVTSLAGTGITDPDCCSQVSRGYERGVSVTPSQRHSIPVAL